MPPGRRKSGDARAAADAAAGAGIMESAAGSTPQAAAEPGTTPQRELFEAAAPTGGSGTGASTLSGHRHRLRSRFMQGGADAMPDYELLELVLFKAIQRSDTKDLSKRLIARFGSFAEVINAPDRLLKEVSGAGDRVVEELKIVRAAALRLMQRQIVEKPVLGSWSQVLEYCRAAMGYEAREVFRILFLDKKNRLIADEVQSQGTVDHTPVYVREVVKRALELSASAIVLVHNHPSGDPTPSKADIDMTKFIIDAGKPLGVTVHDHIIVGRQGHTSFRALKLI